MNMVMDGLIIIDNKSLIQAFNPAAERIFGHRPEEAIGQNLKVLMAQPFHGEDDSYLTSYLAAADTQVTGVGQEVYGKRRDSSVFPMELGINEMEIAGERMFVAAIRDVSEHREAERHAQEDAARMLAVMNTVLDGLLTIDHEGSIQTFNPASARIFGYQPEEVIGQNVKLLMPQPDRDNHDRYLSSYLSTGTTKMIGGNREVRARHKNGSIFPIELSINEMNVVGKRLFVATARDITERKKAEQATLQYIESLSRSNQELDDFAYIASHDLKEPLRGLSNNARFLKEDFDDVIGEVGARRLARITYLCERMERLVDDLLYFSRLGRQDLAMQPTDLNLVINDIRRMMDAALEEAHAKIIIANPLPVITCDLPRMTEAFRNLITNAVKYNDKPEKCIEIGCTERDGRQIFHVRDNGIGIPAQFHKDIFRIFKRLNEEDDKVKGTGVGLTFVKKIIERHGGEIWVESEAGSGATFYFYIN